MNGIERVRQIIKETLTRRELLQGVIYKADPRRGAEIIGKSFLNREKIGTGKWKVRSIDYHLPKDEL